MAAAESAGWRRQLYIVIFESDTPAGKAFDVALLWAILISVMAVMLESVRGVRESYGELLRATEWFFTVLFSAEYLVRLAVVPRPVRYARSFFGVVDLLAVVPTYLSLLLPGAQSLLVIRALRLLRIFRIFKLRVFMGQAQLLRAAMRASAPKITVFLGALVTLVLIMGSVMYVVEGEENGFTSIPGGIYWAIVTMTTVGYGDVVPQTVLGRFLAALLMIAGYSIIAVPTGIVSVELAETTRRMAAERHCPGCRAAGHDPDAAHCKYCGQQLAPGAV